jgi:hypothetical protein
MPPDDDVPFDLQHTERIVENAEAGLYNSRTMPATLTGLKKFAVVYQDITCQRFWDALQVWPVSALVNRYLSECFGGILTPLADHHHTALLQEYINLNTHILDANVKMSSDSACLPDAGRIWCEIKEQFAQLNTSKIRPISDMPRQDLATLQELAAKRVSDGLQDVLYLALLLDPRPSMRVFVKRTGLFGTAADLSLGATDCIVAAVRAIKAVADGITVANNSSTEVGMALTKALQNFLGVRTLKDRAVHCKANKCIAAMQMQACALCSMIKVSGPGKAPCWPRV